MKDRVKEFLTRGDNSRIKACKKETCTRNNGKQQIRLLSDTMKNLHLKFLLENSTHKTSYAMFCRFRPFFVRFPRTSERQTCLCKRHEHLKFKAEKLKKLHILEKSDLIEIAKDIVCRTNETDCMYRACSVCKSSKITFEDNTNTGRMVDYYEWRTQPVVTKTDDNGDKVKTMTVKVKERATIEVLQQEFEAEMKKCSSHLFNI